MPAVRVHVPVKVWVSPTPRSIVPPVPLMVSAAPLTFPVNVAVPAVFVIETVPVVVNAPMLCATEPVMVTPPVVPLTVPPLFIRFPLKVKRKLDKDKVAPLFMVSGTDGSNVFAAFIVIVPVFAMTTPPEAVNGVIHSSNDAVLAVAVL